MQTFQPDDLTPDEKFILSLKSILIHYVGEDNRIDKRTLALRLHTSDRKVRAGVSELQRRGELICTDTDQGDYFYLGSDTEPMERFIAQEYHRGGQIIEKAQALKAALKARHGVDAEQGRLC